MSLTDTIIRDYNPMCMGLNWDEHSRQDQEIWNLVGNDPTIEMMKTVAYNVEYHLGEKGSEVMLNLLAVYEEKLYDKLAEKHLPPSKQYADILY